MKVFISYYYLYNNIKHGGVNLEEKSKMKIFEASEVSDTIITLKNSEQLEKLYSAIEDDEVFILRYETNDDIISEVVRGSSLSSKVKNDELKLKAQELKGVEK